MAITPNMNLDLPTVQVTLGPQWASKLNEALEEVDTHDHTSAKGVQVPTAGININADLNYNDYNVYSLRTVRLSNLGSTPAEVADLGVVYQKNGELAYKDASGNEVVITSGGSVAGATGTITGLSSPASASFSSVTDSFTFSFDASKPAKLNISDIALYEYDNATANPVTIKSPASVAAAYSWTLPTAQASATVELVTTDNTGQLNHAQLAGTANQVNVTQSVTAVTLALPQDIAASSSPTFTNLTLSGSFINPLLAPDGASVSAPGISFTSDPDTGIRRSGADTMQLITGAATRLTVSSSGINAGTGAVTAAFGDFSGGVSGSAGGAAQRIRWTVFTDTIGAGLQGNYSVGSSSAVGAIGWVQGASGHYPITYGTSGSDVEFVAAAGDTGCRVQNFTGSSKDVIVVYFYQ